MAPVSAHFRSIRRPTWQATLVAVLLFIGTVGLAIISVPQAANAANMTVSQCNGVGASAMGATTAMRCDITVVNTINGSHTDSRTTMTRHCALGPCPSGNGTFVRNSTSLVTIIDQCNGSDNDAAHPIRCDVDVINNISATTPGAEPVTAATVNQCVGSATGGGGSKVCSPYPANTTNATVTQCNGSGTGGGGTVNCSVGTASKVSPAVPIRVNQCNGTGNPGGSTVTCRVTITTHVTSSGSSPAPTTGGSDSSDTSDTSGGTGGTSGSSSRTGGTGGTSGGTPSTGSAAPTAGPNGKTPGATTPRGIGTQNLPPQVSRVPTGGIQAGGGSTSGLQHTDVLVVGLALLAMSAAVGLGAWRLNRKASR